jgi:hypothetical protein
MYPRRQVLHKGGKDAMNGLGGDGVIIVKHQDDILRERAHEIIRE